jgi:hypothetical protein
MITRITYREAEYASAAACDEAIEHALKAGWTVSDVSPAARRRFRVVYRYDQDWVDDAPAVELPRMPGPPAVPAGGAESQTRNGRGISGRARGFVQRLGDALRHVSPPPAVRGGAVR